MRGGGAPPYDHIEALDIGDDERFAAETAVGTMEDVAGELAGRTDAAVISTCKIVL